MLYGIAIAMMIFHHLFLNTQNLDFNVVEICPKTLQISAWFCKICVAIYAFISGYGMSKNIKLGDNDRVVIWRNIKDSVKRYFNLMIKFWIVLLFFLPVVYLIIIKNNYSFTWTMRHVLSYFLGWNIETNTAWWYIKLYTFFLAIFPVVAYIYYVLKKIENIKRRKMFGIVVYISALVIISMIYHSAKFDRIGTMLSRNFVSEEYLLIFLEGTIISLYNLFDSIYERIKNTPKYVKVIILILLVIFRIRLSDSASYNKIDVIIVAPFIYLIVDILKDYNSIKSRLCFLGKKSTFMWLVHMFFIYGIYQTISWGKYSLVLYVLLLGESYAAASGLEYIEFIISRVGRSMTLKMFKKYH